MTRFTEQDLRTATHEAAHASAAFSLGMGVEWVSIDRAHPEVDGWGATCTYFRESDQRSVAAKRKVRAIVALAGIRFETMGDLRGSDQDIRRAYKLADGADPDGWIAERSAEIDKLFNDSHFRAAADALAFALLERGTLDEEAALAAGFSGVAPASE